MTAKERDSNASWVDPDAAPELTDDFFATAKPFIGEQEISAEEFKAEARKALRGRPAGSGVKQSTTVRFDTDVLAAFKATGKGWQTRMNNALRDWLKEHRP
ncbi:BrnA antitoxin family protein [Desulfobulbus sp.]|uniref:BrnA antitoxin family protein n=1 Tax=Desulfobulbus sp. TaxID=895 RepID=UPI00286F8B4A|nr:BrnA antitoxin family protein [Desulfobulbus sp.]